MVVAGIGIEDVCVWVVSEWLKCWTSHELPNVDDASSDNKLRIICVVVRIGEGEEKNGVRGTPVLRSH